METRSSTVLQDKINKAVEVILRYGGIDGGHHKQWVLDQALRTLLGDDYSKEISEYETINNQGEKEYEWDEGIPP